MHSLHRYKVFSLLVVAVLLMSMVAACAPSQPAPAAAEPTAAAEPAAEPAEEAAEPAEAAAGAPQQGGTLTVATYAEPTSLDPHVSDNRHTWLVAFQIFDTLVTADDKGGLHPGLAESWEASDDGLSYTMKLRQDVTFHDGTPFNAEAVKYNFDRIMDPATGSLMSATQLSSFESAEVVDEFTVKLNFKKPMGPFLLLAATRLFIVSPTAAEKWGPQDFGIHPVGSGPFKFVEWMTQDHVTLERNPDYNWASPAYQHNGPAYVDQVIFRYIIENQTRTAALEGGEVDIAIRVPEFDVERVRNDGRFEVISTMVPGSPTAFILNTNKAPLDDVRVRRALNMWIDRDQINETIFAGENAPAYGPVTPNTFGYLAEVEELNALNRDQALALLKEAGWEDSNGDAILDKDGQNLHLDIYSCGDYTDPPEAVAGQLNEMGIETKITMVPWADQKRVTFEGLPHMMVGTFNDADPRVLRMLYHSENVGESGWMWTHLHESNPELQGELDALLEKGDETTVLDERKAVYEEIQKLMVENGLSLPLRIDFYIYGIDKKVQGFNNEVGGWLRAYDMWLQQ